METKTRHNMVAILRVLRDALRPLGGERIAEELRLAGVELSERSVRNYLEQADALGWTENLGRRGRRLTVQGIYEVDGAQVMDKVGSVAAKAENLIYQMTFDPVARQGKVILNISTVALEDARAALRELRPVYDARLGMGRYLAVAGEGGQIGEFRVPKGRLAIGTICSMSMNGILLGAKIAVTSRFCGLLQLEQGRPKRFTQVINYDASSLDPLEIFIRGYMTSVTDACQTGSGVIGGSFREVPMVSLPEVQRLAALSEQVGLGGLLVVGRPNQPLLDIPVARGRAGLVVCGGLNAVAAVVESGISTTNAAMGTMCDFEELVEYTDLRSILARSGLETAPVRRASANTASRQRVAG